MLSIETYNYTLAGEGGILNRLNKVGILGFLVIEQGGIPLVIRDYNSNIVNGNPFLLTGFISAINSYASSIHGFLTDIGLGFVRLAMKNTKDHIFCILLSEVISRRIKGEELSMLIQLTLSELISAFNAIYHQSERFKSGLLVKDDVDGFQGLADQILLKSFVNNQKLINN